MAEVRAAEPESGLPPAGSRWGSGAQSVLPYLARSLQARPSAAPEPREQRPGEQSGPAAGERDRPCAG